MSAASQSFYERAANGAYRGSGHSSYAPQRHVSRAPASSFMTDQNPAAWSAVGQPRIYNPGRDRRLCDPNTHTQSDIQFQCQYLSSIVERETNKAVNTKELLEKEAFRKHLEKIVQNLVADYAKDHVTINSKNVRLKCYGSLASGFAAPGSDMDLLLMFPKDQGPIGPLEVESRRMIEKALLDLGYGARLLTKTRVPILQVCQSPNPDLLASLKKEREKWEEETRLEERDKALVASGLDPDRLPSDITDEMSDAATVTFAKLDTEPSIIPLPPSPVRGQANLEYTADVGIQCDINFSNYVAIHNTVLLRCYCKCDPRVRPLGLFVKGWAKARQINTPYHGTLSSYGYIMMVLHYLINVVEPPVLPNLQHIAVNEDAWNNKTDIELFEGFDVRFFQDEHLLERRAAAGQITKNRESLGSLIRGFFRYYTDGRGFHWVNDVISIRTLGGLVTKKSKDWTEAKRAGKDNSIRLRYLLAIEDPFEIDHNIARTVGHSGIVAIRNEFRRAWEILSKIKYGDGHWFWIKDNGMEGEDLFAKVHDRGDLLKQDQDFQRERMRKVRDLERQREAELKPAENGRSALVGNPDGRFSKPSHPKDSQVNANVCAPRSSPENPKLIKSVHVMQDFPMRKLKNLQSDLALVSKGRLNNESKAIPTHIKSTSKDGGYDVSRWIKSTAEANNKSNAANGNNGDEERRGTVDQKSLQIHPEPNQKTQDPACSPTKRPLKSSENFTEPKARSVAHPKHIARANGEDASQSGVTSDPRKPLSAWNVRNRDGCWLIWRDEKIREGTWTGISPQNPRHALNQQYPYDVTRPLPNFEEQNRLANVRARRNQYFQPKGIDRKTSNTEGPLRNRKIHEEARKDSAISMSKPTTALVLKSKPGPQFAQPQFQAKVPSACNRGVAKPPSTSAFTLALSSNDPEVIHASELEIVPILESSLFLSGGPNGHDYREDFPIPTEANFQFDPAQLRDLGIIAKGGSGCARDALEQEYGAYDYDGTRLVELSNEWGGGGRMGKLVSDSGELPALDFASAATKPVVGADDQENLLRELPAGW
jgi:terminal uridylyltransferase